MRMHLPRFCAMRRRPDRQFQQFCDHLENGAEMQFDKELDARGLNCPLPILRTKKALTDMTTGQVLKIVATDAGSVKDFQAFARQTGNDLLSSEAVEKEFIFFMKKK
jgi:tRNA 2-thiouridine synthesizing protein A